MPRASRFLGRSFGVAVLALCVGACTSTAPTPDRVARRVTVSPGPLPSVEGLEIREPVWRSDGSNWGVSLTWVAPSTASIDHYEVWRDGDALDELVTGQTWTDRTAQPATHYRYVVVGITAQGSRTRPERVSIRTDAPPLADARLAGSFVMKLHAMKAHGTDDVVQGGRVVFRFEPACERDVCRVRWTVRQRETDLALARDGAVYSGRGHTPLLIRNCFGDEVDERVVVRIRVVDAAPRHGGWRATRIEGTIAERSAWSGCMVASIRWAVRGTMP